MRVRILSETGHGVADVFDGEALVWTEQEGSVMTLIINTKARRRTYLAPRLESISHNAMQFKAIVDHAESGTLQKLEEHTIILGAIS